MSFVDFQLSKLSLASHCNQSRVAPSEQTSTAHLCLSTKSSEFEEKKEKGEYLVTPHGISRISETSHVIDSKPICVVFFKHEVTTYFTEISQIPLG
jgi:hypothetical protein